jgi:hypothetical protein
VGVHVELLDTKPCNNYKGVKKKHLIIVIFLLWKISWTFDDDTSNYPRKASFFLLPGAKV